MLKEGVQEPHQCWSVHVTMARLLTRTHGIRDAVHTDTRSKSDKTRCDKRKPKNLAGGVPSSRLWSFTWTASHLFLNYQEM